MVFLFGDIHGRNEIFKITNEKFINSYNFTKNDYVIILGDFGVFWASEPDGLEISLLSKIYSLPFTVLFIDGNHENFDRLNDIENISKFGGKVGYCGDNLFWLKRGEIYSIDGFNIFTFGGALSVDKHFRKEGVSWWREEIPSADELNFALQNIQNFTKNGGKIDAVLTHTLPSFAIKKLLNSRKAIKFPDPTANMLEQIFEALKPKKWYCGHFHMDESFIAKGCKFSVIYNDFIRL